MDFMPITKGFLASAAFATAALGIAASVRADAPPPVAAAGAAQVEMDPGENIMNASCQDCHDLRTIQTQAMDAAGWTKTINSMIEMGATVANEDVPVLVKYLSFQHGPVPDGAGKGILLNTCTMCHDLGRIKFGRRSAEEWEETLVSMLNEGAPLNDADFATIHHYLSENFGVD
jgi:cytochrome c5